MKHVTRPLFAAAVAATFALCGPAQAQGLKGGYINRRSRPYEDTPYRPHLVVSDLKELADVLC